MGPDLSDAIRIVLTTAHSMNLDAVLVGALVAELVAAEDSDLRPPRGTNDADFAIKMRSWEEFDRFKKRLEEQGFQPDRKTEHRLHHKSALIDVLPYGPGISNSGEIVWPVSERPMVVLGFEEACAKAVESQVSPNLRVKRLTIPGLVLLKIMSFLDRRAAGNLKYRSDAEDLVYWFNQYASGKEEDRRYGISEKGLSSIPFDHAGAALLGIDVRALATAAAAARIGTFLEAAIDPFGPLANAMGNAGSDDHRERIASLSRAFKQGFEAS
jgi:predicted nucleotidyltransferase